MRERGIDIDIGVPWSAGVAYNNADTYRLHGAIAHAQLVLKVFAVRYVVIDASPLRHATGFVEEWRSRRLGKDFPPVAVAIAIDDAAEGTWEWPLLIGRAVALIEQARVVLPDDFIRSKSQNVANGVTTVDIATLGVLLPEPFSDHLGDLAKALFAFRQRFLGAPLLGHILLQSEKMRDLATRVVYRRDDVIGPIEFAILAAILYLAAPFASGQDRFPQAFILSLRRLPGLQNARIFAQ